MNQSIKPHNASFRDPSGFIYEKDGVPTFVEIKIS